MECWIDGMMGTKTENRGQVSIMKKCKYNIFSIIGCIGCLPLFIPSVPAFHYSIIPLACKECDRKCLATKCGWIFPI